VFFFQAEDGIRAPLVTGVQTCALPIYRVAAVLAQEPGQRRRQLLLVAAVDRAERLELDEADAGIARLERLPDEREHLLALEEVVPQLADGLAAEVGGARGERSRRRGGGGERPHDVVDGLGGRHGPDLYHPRPRRATSRLNGRPALRAVTSISIRIRGSANPAEIIVAAGRQ